MRSFPLAAFAPAEYGGFASEYAALTSGCALFDRACGVVHVRGADAAAFLHGQVTADVASLVPGRGAPALVLTPQGRLVALGFVVHAGEDGFLLVVERAVAGEVAASLGRFLLRMDVQVSVDPDLRVWGLLGPDTDAVVQEAFSALPGVVPFAHVCGGAQRLVRGGPTELADVVVIAPRDELAPPAGAVPAGRLAVDALRVERAIASFGVDVEAGIVPHDADLVPSWVSLDKGCYTGQELVERVFSRGSAVRRLRRVRWQVPAAGERNGIAGPGVEVVDADGVVAGTLTTTAWCPGWGAAGGLGMLHRRVEPGVPVTVGGVPAELV